MMQAAISVEGLGKKYLIGHSEETERYPTMRDAFVRKSSNLMRRAGDLFHGRQLISESRVEEFWALEDVSFDVKPGEIVGIIGRNGAGKSTLLKVLSRITEPTAGRVAIRGRVASLLEVGTGFHPELTGRENIYLNGAILGMSRADIRLRFDEIVAFAEIDKFLDTPVKRYSSGMYVRLAFAVAAHLEPDILIVDEVLAVGDAQFQKKCLGKIGEVANQGGRAVLFVSHQMGMVTSLCQRGILLEAGRIAFDGNASAAVTKYYGSDNGAPFSVDYVKPSKKRVGDQFATLLNAWIEDDHGTEAGEIDIRSGFRIKMRYRLDQPVPEIPVPNFHFYNSQGQCAFVSGGIQDATAAVGTYEATCFVPGKLLNNDTYFIDIALTFMRGGPYVSFHERGALAVVIVDPIEETLDVPPRHGYSGAIPGLVRPALHWNVKASS